MWDLTQARLNRANLANAGLTAQTPPMTNAQLLQMDDCGTNTGNPGLRCEPEQMDHLAAE
jgi:hypothetical protein